MPWRDFREFLSEIERRGQVKTVEGANCDLEIGTLTELMSERMGPMLLFDRIKGFSKGYRIAAKPYATAIRDAIALDLPEGISPFEMLKSWRLRLKNYKPIKPVRVSSGPVMENVLERNAVDLTKFPVPKWHEHDGGPYFGTGCAVITRDPDEEWVNLGAYRCMLHDRTTLGVDIGPYHHGSLHIRKWWSNGKSCPIAVAITPDPYVFCAASNGLPWATEEYDYAGFIKGSPVEFVSGPITQLPVPANAELVVEGEVPPRSVEERLEGPFGEYTGYYVGAEKMGPVIRVQAIYHRTNPILQGDPPVKPPIGHWVCPPPGNILEVWDGLERSGLPGVHGVHPLNTGGALITVVCIKQHYAGHARQIGRIASGLMRNICRVLVVVDEDIDPSNPEEVLWAIATRSDPATSFEILRDCPSSWIDPLLSVEKKRRGELTTSCALVIACRPWEWMDQFPVVNRASDKLRTQVYEKWRSLF